jgi:hypothetical protein
MDDIVIHILLAIFVFFLSPQDHRNNLEMKHYYLLSTNSQYREEFLGEVDDVNTQTKLSNLKYALLAYQSDVGRMPYIGDDSKKKSAYNQELLLNIFDPEKNVLFSDNNKYIQVKNYEKRWKGPYLEGKPSKAMLDTWKTPIQYVPEGKNLYLWSYGPNKKPDFSTAQEAFRKQSSNEVDDIVVSVARFKHSFED